MLIQKLKSTIERHRLIKKGDKILVAVSGGPDSVALIYALGSLKKKFRLRLYLAHLDHMIRRDSHKDREFVEDLAKRLRLPLSSAQVNVRELARYGSEEEMARNARLGFLFRVAKEIRADKIALGHNLDDQAETVLMRILRGAGLYGLSAILPKRNIAGFQIIRPLIEVRRKEIEAYLRKKRVKARIDKTNSQDIYFRNKLRNKLLPLLEKGYNKNIKEVLANLAESSGCDYEYLWKISNKSLSAMSYQLSAKRLNINLRKLLKQHIAIQRMIIRLCISQIKGNTRRISFQHIKEIEDLIASRPFGSIVDLPQGISVVKTKRCLSIYRKNQ